MVKVITYGTYDLLHYGHIKLLERAKALGDYLIVGVTADDFDKTRGKINVQQSLMERIEAVRATGLADKIIVEEYEGQKIDDIRRYDVDIFTVGSDWAGKFDYLNEYCKVVYLPRTEGISSSEVRSEQCKLRMGIVGKAAFRTKFVAESKYVNGVDVIGVCASQKSEEPEFDGMFYTENYDELLEKVDAVYIVSKPEKHYIDAKANFPGHQALVCTHMDGHNGSGNIHVHIVINSLRKLDVPQQPFMERPIDCKAGYKHHVTNEYLKHLQKSLMDLCQREFLHQVDLLSPSRTGVTEAEYWAQRRLDEKKQEIEKEGFTPNPTKFQTQKQLIRDAVAAAREKAISYEDFQNILQDANNDSLFSFITVQQQAVKFGVCRGRRMFKTVEQKLIRGNG